MGIKVCLLVSAAAVFIGCASPQSRAARPFADFPQSELDAERARHGGGAGDEIAYLFNSGEIRKARDAGRGASHGMVGTQFFMVQVAPDPKQPILLVTAGFCLKMQEDRGSLFYYDFFDATWNNIGRLEANGDLYRRERVTDTLVGKFDLNTAALELYRPQSGYGSDSSRQDLARGRMHDLEVSGADPRARGVAHTAHNSAPPVVVMTPYRPGEAGMLAERWRRQRFDESEAQRLIRLREERTGGVGKDESYGGVQYKDGNPVDGNGKPIGPGGLGGK